jgi:drug/metabolite transporter (DMT)-like permease
VACTLPAARHAAARQLIAQQPRLWLLRGLLGFASVAFIQQAVHLLAISDAVALALLSPLVVAALGTLLLRERPPPLLLLALPLATSGALLLVKPGIFSLLRGVRDVRGGLGIETDGPLGPAALGVAAGLAHVFSSAGAKLSVRRLAAGSTSSHHAAMIVLSAGAVSAAGSAAICVLQGTRLVWPQRALGWALLTCVGAMVSAHCAPSLIVHTLRLALPAVSTSSCGSTCCRFCCISLRATHGWQQCVTPAFAPLHSTLPGFVVQSFGHQVLMTAAMQRAPATRAAPLAYLSAVWGLLADYFVFGHPPSSSSVVGGAAIVAGGLLVTWGRHYGGGSGSGHRGGATVDTPRRLVPVQVDANTGGAVLLPITTKGLLASSTDAWQRKGGEATAGLLQAALANAWLRAWRQQQQPQPLMPVKVPAAPPLIHVKEESALTVAAASAAASQP